MKIVSVNLGNPIRPADGTYPGSPKYVDLIKPSRQRLKAWFFAEIDYIEHELRFHLLQALTGKLPNRYDADLALHCVRFCDKEWDPQIVLRYGVRPDWKYDSGQNILHVEPDHFLPLWIVATRMLNQAEREDLRADEWTLAEVKLLAGVRYVGEGLSALSLFSLNYTIPARFQSIWAYVESAVRPGDTNVLREDLQIGAMWGPLDLRDPRMRQFLPHRCLFKTPLGTDAPRSPLGS